MAKIIDDDIADIEARCWEVAACLPDDDRLAELSRQFHFRIYECARSPMLLLMRLLRRWTTPWPGSPPSMMTSRRWSHDGTM